MMTQEIWVVPFFGQGHLLPSIELCKHIASRKFVTTLIIPADLSSNIPDSLHQHPLIQIAQLPSSPPPSLFQPLHNQMAQGLENLLSTRSQNPESTLPVCVVVDVMMGWTLETFEKIRVPTIGFFTSGACSAAMEYAMWKAQLDDLKPGEIRLLPGLPEEMAVSEADLKHKHGSRGGPPDLNGPPGPRGGFPRPPGGMGPSKIMGQPKPGAPPPWLEEVKCSIAYMINTSDDLEGVFIQYLANQVQKPVWGAGPLLPELYWKTIGSLLHDHEIRANRPSNVTEEEVIAWLDSKPLGSVLYVSFGTEVGPSMEEYPRLADALETSNRPFIWVIQPGSGRPGPTPQQSFDGQPRSEDDEGYFPRGLDKRVGERGLIIRGWAPQLLILSHSSVGGFLSHCGWNSSVEAIGLGVPFLAWPIRGDQHYNAKLILNHLKVGRTISDDLSQLVKKEDVVKGIECLLGDENIKKRAALLKAKFKHGFPACSVDSFDAFRDFVSRKAG